MQCFKNGRNLWERDKKVETVLSIVIFFARRTFISYQPQTILNFHIFYNFRPFVSSCYCSNVMKQVTCIISCLFWCSLKSQYSTEEFLTKQKCFISSLSNYLNNFISLAEMPKNTIHLNLRIFRCKDLDKNVI